VIDWTAILTSATPALVLARLELWLMHYVWPRLTTEEKTEIRQIIPEGMEDEIKAALGKLP